MRALKARRWFYSTKREKISFIVGLMVKLCQIAFNCRILAFCFMNSLFLPDAEATRAWGAQIGAQLRAGDLLTLSGELGAGKTTFTQGLAQSLGIAEPISSPTFVLINEYPSQIPLLHLDAYRLEGLEWDELRDAGLEDFLSRDDAIRVIEWPQMIEKWLPPQHLEIRLENEGEGRRARIFGF